MAESLLIVPLIWVVTAAGLTLSRGLRLPETATPLERNLVACGLGLGLLAYGVLLLGLLHLLYPLAGLLWVMALAMLGGMQHVRMARAVGGLRPGRIALWGWAAALLFAAYGLIALIGVYAPPVVFLPGVNATEWDSLSYHLADPKLFVAGHQVVGLPWQPHSHFAFTAEMWDTLALLAHGSVPLAKWFSWVCAAGTTLGIFAIAARHLTPRTGVWASLLFAATPLAFWEAGTAYIDGATAFYATLGLLCLMNGVMGRERGWLLAGAALAGLCFSTKATGLEIILLLALWLLIAERRARTGGRTALGRGLGWGTLAVLLGSPWYIKSWIETGNPVYPYFFRLFGGRWWDAQQAAAYAGANDPGKHTLQALLLLPWTLTMALPPGHLTDLTQPFNEFPTATQALLPVLLAALFFPAWRPCPVPPVIKALGLYALAATILWFTQVQFIRFLLPVVPVFCLLCAWVLDSALAGRSTAGYTLAGVAGLSLLWSLTVGIDLASLQWPVVSGVESKVAYRESHIPGYGAVEFINRALPPGSKVALFGYPLGFDCDRPYLWADQSAYVLTPQVNSPGTLLSRLRSLGVTDVLVDRQSFPLAPGGGPTGWLYALTAAQGSPLYPPSGNGPSAVVVYHLPSGT